MLPDYDHIQVIVYSSKFDDLSIIQRHRLVNACLQHELANGVHALSIVAKGSKDAVAPIQPSPLCLGGMIMNNHAYT